jgi:hypothetical protein
MVSLAGRRKYAPGWAPYIESSQLARRRKSSPHVRRGSASVRQARVITYVAGAWQVWLDAVSIRLAGRRTSKESVVGSAGAWAASLVAEAAGRGVEQQVPSEAPMADGEGTGCGC